MSDPIEINEVDSFYLRNSSWIRGISIALIIQAVLGIIAIEYAFSRLKRMQQVDEKRDSQFQGFRRLDAKKWHRCKFYPGAMFSMPARMLILIL